MSLTRNPDDLVVKEIFSKSIQRAKRWHKGAIDDWNLLEWAGAMCGEAGETANLAKKLRRVEMGLVGQGSKDVEEYRKLIAKEACDTILYAVLVIASTGCPDPEQLLRDVFNDKSREFDFPERI